MDNFGPDTAEAAAAAAFTQQSDTFDSLYSSDAIIAYKRQRVRKTLLRYLAPASRILELNAGTGEDAVFLAAAGHHVHATDISDGMLHQLRRKAANHQLDEFISSERCSFTSLDQLKQQGPYDCIFSNFAGLNCSGHLDKVLDSFADLLTPKGIIVLVILPRFCLWESLLAFRGHFKTATRRFFRFSGARAKIDDRPFHCWYYPPRFVISRMKQQFDILSVEGLCTIVPPSYIAGFAESHPRLFRYLQRKEDKLCGKWPWKGIGDYYIISLKKKM